MSNSSSSDADSAVPDVLTTELIADYDAGALSRTAAEAVRRRIDVDPGAQRVLHALAAVRADLVAQRVDEIPVPADVTARIEHTIEALRPR